MGLINCVIFDCDGTLIDSEKLCCRAVVNTFKQVGIELEFDEVQRQFVGGKVADILSHYKSFSGCQVSLDMLEPIYRNETAHLFAHYLKPMPGASSLLDSLTKQGIEYALVTNGPTSKTESLLSMVGLLDKFRGKIVSAFDANSWKPEPDLLKYAIMILGFVPDECIYVDDTKKGVEMGLNVGIRTVHFTLNKEIPESELCVVCSSLDDVGHYISEVSARCGGVLLNESEE
ncbi:HAD-IA family hydrolase [Vibrio sp. ZSDZ34]|uniref:HAD-IA family hydrolase n=1 Tax=Vibrio gelatinilyticus TaxID=2893468 RepID=A0A9X1WBJ8_9VIBR|nr:HAD-IA family hydrolase [Vibrio gelatinilyticus]MCJ2377061.1 HAD-IA family hydrolase [Vibrio gelatinilyticus]